MKYEIDVAALESWLNEVAGCNIKVHKLSVDPGSPIHPFKSITIDDVINNFGLFHDDVA